MTPIQQSIQSVRYYNINGPSPDFFYDTFHCFDLGVNIEFENGENMHIGWSKNERIEFHKAQYQPEKLYDAIDSIDATPEWSKYLGRPITNFDIEYVSEEWNIPSYCKLTFEGGDYITIVLSETGPTLDQLPRNMEYFKDASIFVFMNQDPPPIITVKVIPAKYTQNNDAQKLKRIDAFTNKGLGLLMVALAIGAVVIHLIIRSLT